MKPAQLKRILVPIDFSKTSLYALEQAVFMARLFKADLYLIHAIDIAPTIYTIDNPASPGPDISEIDKGIAARFDRLVGETRKKSAIRIRTIVTHGRTAKEIVNAVADYSIDLVVMGTHGLSGLDEYFIGSNAHKVVTACPCPVITVQRKSKKIGYQHILVPVSNSMHSREKINYVMLLAKRFGSVIHILGLPDDKDPLHEKQFAVKIRSIENVIRKAGLACTCKIVHGDNLAEVSLKYARRVKADLIAVLAGSESRYGFFLRPFAKQIVNHSKTPVLTIKPTEGTFEFYR